MGRDAHLLLQGDSVRVLLVLVCSLSAPEGQLGYQRVLRGLSMRPVWVQNQHTGRGPLLEQEI